MISPVGAGLILKGVDVTNLHKESISPSTTAQLPIVKFMHEVEFPHQFIDESWNEFVERAQAWAKERCQKARESGAYRAVPYPPDLTTEECGLLLQLAWLSYSEGLGQYAP